MKHSCRQVFWLRFIAFTAFPGFDFPVTSLCQLPFTAAAPRGVCTHFLIKSIPLLEWTPVKYSIHVFSDNCKIIYSFKPFHYHSLIHCLHLLPHPAILFRLLHNQHPDLAFPAGPVSFSSFEGINNLLHRPASPREL